MLKLKTVINIKKILILFVIICNFQSFTKADDITEFEIEGMSIGDNLLNHISKNNIEKLTENYYKDNLYTAITVFPDDNTRLKFETYDAVVLNFLTNDTNYELQAISGIIIYEENIIDCTKKSDQIVTEFKTFIVNTEVENNNFEGVYVCESTIELERTFALLQAPAKQVIKISCNKESATTVETVKDAISAGKRTRFENTRTASRFGHAWATNVVKNPRISIHKMPKIK